MDRPWIEESPSQEWRRSELFYLDLEKQAIGCIIYGGRTQSVKEVAHIKGMHYKKFYTENVFYEKSYNTYAKVKPYLQNYCTPSQERKDVGGSPAKRHTKLPHTPCTQGGWSVHQSQRRSLVRLTEDLPKDSKQRGEMAALYARPQGRSGVGWQRLPHTKSTATP